MRNVSELSLLLMLLAIGAGVRVDSQNPVSNLGSDGKGQWKEGEESDLGSLSRHLLKSSPSDSEGSNTAGSIHQHANVPHEEESEGNKGSGNRVPVLSILLYTTLMALASGLGAVPFLIFGRLSDYWSGMANAVAVGVMFTASYELLHEGGPYSPGLTVLGMCIGGLFIKFSQDHLSKYENCSFEDLEGADARKAILIVGVMAAHAFGEGSGVGVSFSGERGWAQGMLVTIAIGLHNIPEGMAVAGVMMSKGSTPAKAVYWTLLCALPQAVVAVPSYLFVETFAPLLPLALGFAAGCMIWIAFAELIPDALAAADHSHVATAATLSAAWLQGLSMLIEGLEQPGGGLASPIQADCWSVAWCVGVLLPSLLVPAITAFLAQRLLPSAPLTLGASVGVLSFLGASNLLWLVLHGSSQPGGQSPSVTLAFAAAGAVAVFIVWPSISNAGHHGHSLDPEHHAGVDSATGLTWGGHVEGMPVKHADPSKEQSRSHENGKLCESSLLQPHTDEMWDANFRMSPAASQMQSMTDFVVVELQQQRDKTAAEPSGNPLSLDGINGHCQARKPAAGPPSVSEHSSQLLMKGYANQPPQPCNPKSDLLGGALSITAHLFPAGLLCTCLLTAQGVPLGMSLAKAVASNSDGSSTHLLLPLALTGVPLGLACVGLGKAISGAGWKSSVFIALALAWATATSTACCLATLPLGMAGSGHLDFDVAGWTLSVQAVMGGALLVAALLFLWPSATAYKAKRARAGLILGIIVVAVPWTLKGLLCMSTPYCLGQVALQ